MANPGNPGLAQALAAIAGAISVVQSGNNSGSISVSQALEQSSQPPQPTNQPESQSQPRPATPVTTVGGTSTRESPALRILPSYLKRKASDSGGNKGKRPKVVKTWDRDIVCIPQSKQSLSAGGTISFPRGSYRAQLGGWGLIGKLHLRSDMPEDEVSAEIRSVFKEPMGNNPNFQFQYLQSTGCGSKSLSVPSQSSSFKWNAQQVARLGGQKGIIYIQALSELAIPELHDKDDSSEVEDEMDEVFGPTHDSSSPIPAFSLPQPGSSQPQPVPTQPGSSQLQLGSSQPQPVPTQPGSSQPQPVPSSSQLNPPQLSPSQAGPSLESYRRYVELIDLTTDEEGISLSSDEDELPVVSLSSSRRVERKVDSVVIKHVIQQHRCQVMVAEGVQRITVRRTHIVSDALRQFSKSSFDETKLLQVRFIGESAQDEGGPRREFFHLLMYEIFKSELFSGFPEHVVLLHNVDAVSKNTFYVIGKMMATCIIQGGEVPMCFSKAVADYLVSGQVTSEMCLDDIPDYEIRTCVQKVCSSTSTEQLQALLDSDTFSFRFYCGLTKPTTQVTIQDKNEIARSIWLHFVLFHPYAELEQFRKGLYATLEFERLVCIHPHEVWGLLADSTLFKVTSQYLNDSFVIDYSPNGSNNRTREEAIVMHWNEYLDDCDSRSDVTLEEALKFLSGSSKLPATGFDVTPKIKFTDDDCLPKVSTCEISITFPRKIGLLDFDSFKDTMDLCILGSYGFGCV